MGIWSRRSAVIATTAATTLTVVGAAAWAFWLTSASGSVTAKAGTALQLVAEPGSTAGRALYPGGKGDLKVKVTNPNPFRVQLGGLVPKGQITADPGHPNCRNTGVTLTEFYTSTDDQYVGPNSTVEVLLPDAVTMAANSDNGCQGASFKIPVLIFGGSG